MAVSPCSGLSLFLILYAITSITGSGWTRNMQSSSGFGILAFIGFIIWEKCFSSPFLDLVVPG